MIKSRLLIGLLVLCSCRNGSDPPVIGTAEARERVEAFVGSSIEIKWIRSSDCNSVVLVGYEQRGTGVAVAAVGKKVELLEASGRFSFYDLDLKETGYYDDLRSGVTFGNADLKPVAHSLVDGTGQFLLIKLRERETALVRTTSPAEVAFILKDFLGHRIFSCGDRFVVSGWEGHATYALVELKDNGTSLKEVRRIQLPWARSCEDVHIESGLALVVDNSDLWPRHWILDLDSNRRRSIGFAREKKLFWNTKD